MVGIIVNRYTKDRREVEIIEVESTQTGSTHLVNAREFRGGKVWLNTFTDDDHTESAEMVNRYSLHPLHELQAA